MCTSCVLVFSGFLLPTIYAKVASGDINGIFCVLRQPPQPSLPNICTWLATLTTPIVINFYSDATCSTLIGTVSITDLEIDSTNAGGINALAGVIAGVSGQSLNVFVFRSATTVASNCIDGTYSQLGASCGAVSGVVTLGTGGSISLVANGC